MLSLKRKRLPFRSQWGFPKKKAKHITRNYLLQHGLITSSSVVASNSAWDININTMSMNNMFSQLIVSVPSIVNASPSSSELMNLEENLSDYHNDDNASTIIDTTQHSSISLSISENIEVISANVNPLPKLLFLVLWI